MLFGERQSDNCNRQYDPKNQMRKGNPDAAQENPDDIEYGGKTSGIAGHFPHMLSKREERHNTNFEALDTERNANDRQAEGQTGEHIFQKNDKSAENKPDDVSNEVHDAISFKIYAGF